jgi:hypothetical protein
MFIFFVISLSACILSLAPSVLGATIVSIVIAGSCSLFLDSILSVSDVFDVSGVFLWGVLHRVSSSRAIVGRCSDTRGCQNQNAGLDVGWLVAAGGSKKKKYLIKIFAL